MKLKFTGAIAVFGAAAIVSALPAAALDAGTGGDVQARAAAVAKAAAAGAKPTRAELERRPQVLRKTGGFLDVAAKGTAVVVLEGRRKGGGAAGQFAEVFGRLSRYNARVERLELETVGRAAEAARGLVTDGRAAFALAVVDDGRGSGLTVFPEERVAVVNAARYRGGDDPLAPEVRVVKELWRALGFVSGIGYAPFRNDVFQPAFSVAELDALEYQVMQPLNFQKMYAVLSRFGVKRARHIPYRLAVIEGWAPAPTNAYQRAVWDEVKSEKERGPSNALKIVPGK